MRAEWVRYKSIRPIYCSVLLRDFDGGHEKGFLPLFLDTLHWVDVLEQTNGGNPPHKSERLCLQCYVHQDYKQRRQKTKR